MGVREQPKLRNLKSQERSSLYDQNEFVFTAAAIAPDANGDSVIFRIINPSDSGRIAIVTRLVVRINAARSFRINALSPAGATLATKVTTRPRFVTGGASKVTASRADDDPTRAGNRVLDGIWDANTLIPLPLTILLPEDSSMEVEVGSQNDTLTSDQIYCNIEWVEEPT